MTFHLHFHLLLHPLAPKHSLGLFAIPHHPQPTLAVQGKCKGKCKCNS